MNTTLTTTAAQSQAVNAPAAPPASDLRFSRIAIVAVVGLLIWFSPRPEAVDPRAWHLLAIFAATIVGIVAKALPMGAVALVSLATILLTRTLTLAETLSGFSNGTLWLIISAFVIAAGFTKTGLGSRIAYGLVSLFGRRTLGLSYSLTATDLVLAPAIASNTARAGGVIFPILQAIAKSAIAADPVKGRQTSAFLTVTAYQANVVTSAMFLTAMVGNPLVVQLAATQGITITWTLWALAAAVPGLVSLVVVPVIVYYMCPPGAATTPEAPEMAKAALRNLGPMSRGERLMGTIAVCLLVAWIFGPWLALDPTAAAIIGIAALLLTGVLTWEDILVQREAWNTFIWVGTFLMMAAFLGQLGLLKWFSGVVGVAFGGIGWVPAFLGISLTYFYTHYFFAANSAHISAMYVPFLAVATGLGTPPLLAALVLAFFSNLFSCTTHYGTPPGPILFGSGYVSLAAWWKAGAVISVVHMVVWIGLGGLWWRVLGLW